MKTKTFLLLCLLLGMGLTQTYAQDWPPAPPEGNRSLTLQMDWPYWTGVFCDGVLIDELNGTVSMHCTLHFSDGIYIWGKYTLRGEATGLTGEIFSIKEKDIEEDYPSGIYDVHYNLKGDQGNHYIGNLIYDFSNYPDIQYEIIHTVCIEN